MLEGFCVGWKHRLSGARLLEVLAGSHSFVLAFDEEADRVIGFINALSDGVLMVFIPLLEVLPEYQGIGIGKMLVEEMLSALKDYYAVDLLCDDDSVGFYESLGMQRVNGMVLRRFDALARICE